MRTAPLSPKQMAAAGWTRTDPRPWRTKLDARWAHTSGWRLDRCGHATALTPWALYAPDGAMVCTGAAFGRPPNPAFGTAWPDLRTAVSYVATVAGPPAPIRVHTAPMLTVTRTTVSRDPALVALVEARPDYPGASAVLDAADRAWLREHGVDVPDRAPAVPLHEAARLARQGRMIAASKKKIRKSKPAP